MALQKRVAEFVAEHGDLALERFDGEDTEYDKIRESLESMPFLASKKLVVLRSPSAQKQFVERVDALLDGLDDTTDVIIVEPKLDKRLGYYKYLKAHTEFQEFKEPDSNGLASWLVSEAKVRGGTLSISDARYLVERCGTNQQLLSGELDKLVLYDPTITRDTIDMLTESSPQSTIFQLLDALFAGRSRQAMELYEQQRQLKVEPQQIIAMLAWQLHIVAVVKAAGTRSDAAIASEAKISPYVVSKTRAITRSLSPVQIRKLITTVLDIDIRSKTGRVNPDEALQNLLVLGVA